MAKKTQTKPKALTSKTVKVMILKNHCLYAYVKGFHADVPIEQIKTLKDLGIIS